MREITMSKYTLFLKTNNPNQSDYECYHTDLTVSELNNKIKIYSNYSWVIGFEVVKLESKAS
jgi:hypothetical protein